MRGDMSSGSTRKPVPNPGSPAGRSIMMSKGPTDDLAHAFGGVLEHDAVTTGAGHPQREAGSMDVWGITVATLRRWYIFVPLIALTAFATVSVGRGVAPEYEATGAAMLVPGPGAVAEEDWVPNPLGSMETANVVIGIVVTGPEARDLIASYGLNREYELSQGSRSALMNVDVRDESPAVAVETATAVLELVADELEARQVAANIPKNGRYRLQVLRPPFIENAVTDGKLRNMAIAGVLGAAASLLITVFFDDLVGLVRRRRRGKAAAAADDEVSGDEAAGEVDAPADEPAIDPARTDPDLAQASPSPGAGGTPVAGDTVVSRGR